MKKIIALCIFASILSACIPREALSELERLCEKDAGLKKFGTVKASGYYHYNFGDSNFWLKIIDTDYQFIESCSTDPLSHYTLNQPGCWTVRKIDRASGRCNERIDIELAKYRAHNWFSRDHCFEAVRNDQPTARYGYFLHTDKWPLDNRWKSVMYRKIFTVKDMETDEPISLEVTYALSPKPGASPFPKPWKYCSSLEGGYHMLPNFLERTIVTN